MLASFAFAAVVVEDTIRETAPSLNYTLIAPSTPGSADNEFQLVKLPNAKCIDGSPAAYYIARNESSTAWVVWLEGGGICLSLDDCIQRAGSDLGSSKNYSSSISAPRGMLSSDPAE